MISKILSIDFTTVILTGTGAAASVVAWMSEHEIMGGWVLFTLGVLQLAKAYAVYKKGKTD